MGPPYQEAALPWQLTPSLQAWNHDPTDIYIGGVPSDIQKSRIMHENQVKQESGLFPCINDVHKDSMIYGYARVSTDGQSVAAQVRRLTEAGCGKVFREVASGAKTNRKQLGKESIRIYGVIRLRRLEPRLRIPENSPRHSEIYSPIFPAFIRPGIPRFTRPGSGLCGW
jgi:hypothetical protein